MRIRIILKLALSKPYSIYFVVSIYVVTSHCLQEKKILQISLIFDILTDVLDVEMKCEFIYGGIDLHILKPRLQNE